MSIDDLGADEALTLLQALQQFKSDHLPDYQISSAIADSNTFTGGIVAAQSARSASLIAQMKYIEGLLKKYQQASGAQRAPLKVSINSAYKTLNSQFGAVLNKYISRTGKRGPILSRRQGMKAALKNRTNMTNSAQARPLLNAANGFQYVSKGMIALDIGFRTRNVVQADNMTRTFTAESFGFAFSFGTGLAGGAIATTLALGPLGWIVALVVIGVAAVGTDFAGKTFGEFVYDSASSLYIQ